MSRPALLAALLAFGGAPPGAAAGPGAGAAAGGDRLSRDVPAAAQSRYAAAVLERESAARILTVGILFPAGSAEDPPGREGTAALLAGVLRRQGAPALARHGAAFAAELSESDLHVTLMAPPAAWRGAFAALETLLYGSPLSGEALEAARNEVAGILAFEAGAPGRAFDLERARLLRGADAPGARPALGTAASTGSVTLADLEAFRRAHLRPEDATLAAHGPVEPPDLASLIGTEVEEVPGPAGNGEGAGARTAAGSPRPGTLPAGWERGERILVDRDLRSSWVSAAIPFPPGTPDLHLGFLLQLARQELDPVPPEPGLFHADASTAAVDGVPVLVLTASVDPGITPAWEERLAGLVAALATGFPDGTFFQLARRRFRTRTLLELAVPEARVEWMARRRAAGLPPLPDLAGEIGDLDRNAVLRTAGLAGPARVIVYGPAEMMGR